MDVRLQLYNVLYIYYTYAYNIYARQHRRIGCGSRFGILAMSITIWACVETWRMVCAGSWECRRVAALHWHMFSYRFYMCVHGTIQCGVVRTTMRLMRLESVREKHAWEPSSPFSAICDSSLSSAFSLLFRDNFNRRSHTFAGFSSVFSDGRMGVVCIFGQCMHLLVISGSFAGRLLVVGFLDSVVIARHLMEQLVSLENTIST